jgi:integrase
MPREKRTRNANGRSSVFEDAHGVWHGWVTVGVKENGESDRRHMRGKTKTAVTEKVKKLERERDAGSIRRPGQTWTVEKWLLHWLCSIVAPPAITQNAYDAYEVAVRVHLIPGVGAHRLDKLEPEHLERLYRRMVADGAKPGRAHQVHRTVRAALGEAHRRKHIVNNPAALARPPKVDEQEIEPYTVSEIQRIMQAAKSERNSARWALALALGLRQGETLGLKWARIDFAGKEVAVDRNRLRPKWAHGCDGNCGKKPGFCAKRVRANDDLARTKSKAGTREIGLPEELLGILRKHREEQDAERRTACDLWEECGFVFTTPRGRPVNPSTDYHAWKRLLARAGVPERRLHDARHTAATVLLLLGVPERTVMSVMGWASTSMAARYQHVGAEIRRQVAQQVGSLLWSATEPDAGSTSEGDDRDDPAPAA